MSWPTRPTDSGLEAPIPCATVDPGRAPPYRRRGAAPAGTVRHTADDADTPATGWGRPGIPEDKQVVTAGWPLVGADPSGTAHGDGIRTLRRASCRRERLNIWTALLTRPRSAGADPTQPHGARGARARQRLATARSAPRRASTTASGRASRRCGAVRGLGPGGQLRELWQLAHQHRQRLLRRAAVLVQHVGRLRRSQVRRPGRTARLASSRSRSPAACFSAGPRCVAGLRSARRFEPQNGHATGTPLPSNTPGQATVRRTPHSPRRTSSTAQAPPGEARAPHGTPVRSGDTLRKIARKLHVHGGWHALYRANRTHMSTRTCCTSARSGPAVSHARVQYPLTRTPHRPGGPGPYGPGASAVPSRQPRADGRHRSRRSGPDTSGRDPVRRRPRRGSARRGRASGRSRRRECRRSSP